MSDEKRTYSLRDLGIAAALGVSLGGGSAFVGTEAPEQPLEIARSDAPTIQASELDPQASANFASQAKEAEAQGQVACGLVQFANRKEPSCYCKDQEKAGWLAEVPRCEQGVVIWMDKDGKVWSRPL